GTTVYVDYRAEKQLSYNFDAINKTFGVSLFLFRNRLELYYRSNEQNYDNVDIGPLKILKIVSQKVYGSRLSINSIAVGFEYDRMNSNIVPYRSSRYFITFNRYLNYRIRLSLTGDWREYELIQTRELQKFASVYGSLVYNLSRLSQLKLLGNYRFQEGRGIDLNLNSLRGEFVTRYHNVFITLGLEYFRRDFSGEKIYFNNAYVRIERKF
ncbi:MAG: hypothetical protein ACE5GL_05185, partial [Calditrichia bacterium]